MSVCGPLKRLQALRDVESSLGDQPITAQARFQSLTALGQAASRYRQTIYQKEIFSGVGDQPVADIRALLDLAQAAIDHSIGSNRRADGLYDAYNLLGVEHDSVTVDKLYPMLEGQVAALSAGAIEPAEAAHVVQALFNSEIYRADQKSFMLYPDRKLRGFLQKNRISDEQLESAALLRVMLADGDERLVVRDADGCCRFNADFTNASDLKTCLNELKDEYGDAIETDRARILALYETVFHHKAFTGRSGTMFSFEGLGSIYWHMVAKLMLAVQENYFAAIEQHADQSTCRELGQLYYRIRQGIGFNKTPDEYGAFPTDPYSHTPSHSGAKQPGMTGQVKEELLCRFGELGVRVANGVVCFQPDLLREREFIAQGRESGYLDVDGDWQTIDVPAHGLAFTWCQVPVIYRLGDATDRGLVISLDNGEQRSLSQQSLSAEDSAGLFQRSGRIRQIEVTISRDDLFTE